MATFGAAAGRAARGQDHARQVWLWPLVQPAVCLSPGASLSVGTWLSALTSTACFSSRPAPALFLALAPITTSTPVKLKSELEGLTEAVRRAEADLDAATTRSAVNAAAKRLMMARAELKRLQDEPAGASRPAASRAGAKAGVS